MSDYHPPSPPIVSQNHTRHGSLNGSHHGNGSVSGLGGSGVSVISNGLSHLQTDAENTYPETRVLIIGTGGTICMQQTPDGLQPTDGFLENAMAPRPSFNDASPRGIYIPISCIWIPLEILSRKLGNSPRGPCPTKIS